jgi:hypothetical protein
MDNNSVRLALAIVALVLAAIDLVQKRGQSLVAWAVVAVSVALCTAYWPD